MKKTIHLICISLTSISLWAQNAIPNGDFESWTSGTYNVPQYFTGSNLSTFFQCNSPFNCVKTTDAYHGTYALQLTTNVGSGDTCLGYAVNANPNNGGNNPCSWPGGIPYSQVPTGLRGYYKCNVVPGDSAGVFLAFKSAGGCLGIFLHKFYGNQGTYTPFFIPISLSGTPDSLIFGAISSDVFDNIQKNGSMLQLDSLSFTGGVSQPANFNGDFENWQSQTLNKPNGWYLQTNQNGDGILQTTDNASGTYAMELKTFLGNRGNGSSSVAVANPAGISTGYYLNSCGGPNCQKGGNPFTNQIDTLAFYYKYVPSGSDTAMAGLYFKKSGNNVYNTNSFLLASASYQYMEVPFNIGSTVDTVIVSFQSSSYRDSALSFIGSDFKIDEVHFKSQAPTTGIKSNNHNTMATIYPNPSNDGVFIVNNIKTFDLIRVYNIYGQEVNAQITKQADYANVRINTAGAYFVQVNSEGKVTTKKVLVGSN